MNAASSATQSGVMGVGVGGSAGGGIVGGVDRLHQVVLEPPATLKVRSMNASSLTGARSTVATDAADAVWAQIQRTRSAARSPPVKVAHGGRRRRRWRHRLFIVPQGDEYSAEMAVNAA